MPPICYWHSGVPFYSRFLPLAPSLQFCIIDGLPEDNSAWTAHRPLKLNTSETELLPSSPYVDNITPLLVEQSCSLCFIFNISFAPHIQSVIKPCCFCFYGIAKMWLFLSVLSISCSYFLVGLLYLSAIWPSFVVLKPTDLCPGLCCQNHLPCSWFTFCAATSQVPTLAATSVLHAAQSPCPDLQSPMPSFPISLLLHALPSSLAFIAPHPSDSKVACCLKRPCSSSSSLLSVCLELSLKSHMQKHLSQCLHVSLLASPFSGTG